MLERREVVIESGHFIFLGEWNDGGFLEADGTENY